MAETTRSTFPCTNKLIRCERVKRAAVAADYQRGVPSDDPGALPGRCASEAGQRAAGARRARDGGARARRRAAAAARRARPRHRNHHQVHLHRDHRHPHHRQPTRRAPHHRSKNADRRPHKLRLLHKYEATNSQRHFSYPDFRGFAKSMISQEVVAAPSVKVSSIFRYR